MVNRITDASCVKRKLARIGWKGAKLEPLLFGVGPADAVTYAAIAAFLAAVSAVASWIPARRAGRVGPAEVLRAE